MTVRVDFYQLSRDPVDVTVAKLARKVLQAGERLVVVSGDAAQRDHLARILWDQGGTAFLANGMADAPHAARQPILLAGECVAPNEARMVLIADGQWREEALGFARVLLLFDAAQRDGAVELWRRFAADEAIDNRINKQGDNGAWREGA